jgi:hypothetical protein
MNKLFLVAMLFVLLYAGPASAIPVLYDLTGLQTVDQHGILIGSYIYDPDTNKAYDWNLGAIYTSLPSFTDSQSHPTAWASPSLGVSLKFSVVPLFDTIRVADISGGFMPMYYYGTDITISTSDGSFLNNPFAIRFNSASCYGCSFWVRPTGTWSPILYSLLQYQTPAASVPEPSSLLLMGTALIGLAFVASRPFLASHAPKKAKADLPRP